MKNVVVVGSQWGDEGKGKIVDWLSSEADVVARFQGGHNAGHTLVIDNVTYNSFNIDFGMTTNKFIELKSESARQAYYDYSLLNIKNEKQFNNDNLLKLIQAYVDIANADDFIHEKEVTLIQHAINIWELNININKPKSGKKLEIKN